MSSPPAPRHPDCVPTLVDTASGVMLRAHREEDLAAIVQQSLDPDSQRWTTVPMPPGGYTLEDARAFAFGLVAAGWADGTAWGWAIEADVAGGRAYCGSIDLRLNGDGTAEVGFGLHPAARGQSVMSTALRLLRDYAFDVRGLAALRWRALVGNWGSRRVAAAAGFRFDGTVRRLLWHRGELRDGWLATLIPTDPRAAVPWLDPPALSGERVRLRAFSDDDVPAIVEACSDARTQYWLASLPDPYGVTDAQHFLGAVREAAATGEGLHWCVADPHTGHCVGCISLVGFGGYSRRTEIGYWTHPAARARGLMTEALHLVADHAEDQFLTDSIMIRCATTNTASRRVAESAGFAFLGVLPRSELVGDGSLLDLVLYSRP
jgi:ribosomal-protein-alanine N-acetyltransferase